VALHPASRSRDRLEAALEGLAAFDPHSGGGEAAARHYLIARVALRLGRLEAFRENRDELAALMPDSEPVGTFKSDLLRELEALEALAEGDPEAGLEALLRASYWQAGETWLGFPPGTYLDGRVPDREPMFLRAELLHSAGRMTEAIPWYEVAAEGIWHRGPGLLRLAEIRAGEGGFPEAEELVARVRGIWADGDDEAAETLRRTEDALASGRGVGTP